MSCGAGSRASHRGSTSGRLTMSAGFSRLRRSSPRRVCSRSVSSIGGPRADLPGRRAGHGGRQSSRRASRTPADGARLVARAWVDPEFKRRLLADARSAALELGLDPGPSPIVVAVETPETVHHMIVCTLCSCYPRALLGPPPAWYKSLPYRSRAVSDPRGVLAEFGVDLGDDVQLRVVDSTADIRYLVIPRRPPGTDHLSEEH